MFGRAGNEIDRLIAKKKYGKAAARLREAVAANPDNHFLHQQLADTLARDGRTEDAVRMLEALAEKLASTGFATKAIAVLKKIKRIDPERPTIEARIAELVSLRREESEARRPAPEQPSAGSDGVPLSDPDPLTERAAASPLFDRMSADELAALIRGLILHGFAGGEIVCSEGEPGQSMFLLVSGSLRVYVRNERGHNNQVRMLRAGDFFGEISLIAKQARTATITCAEDCEILELDTDALREISREHPEVPRTIHDFYQSRLNSPEERKARA